LDRQQRYFAALFWLTILLFAVLQLPNSTSSDAASIASINMSLIVSDLDGNNLIQTTNQSQVVVSVTLLNDIMQHQPYYVIIEIRDESGITEQLFWSSGVLSAGSSKTVGVSFIPTKSIHAVRAFALSDLDNPRVLSFVIESQIRVGSEKILEEVTVFEDYPLPSVEILRNYTRAQAREIQSKVCIDTPELFDIESLPQNDPNATKWLPQQLTFGHLAPKQTLYRIGCSMDGNGIQYSHYVVRNNILMRSNEPIFVDSFKLLFPTFSTAEQALEYVAYFWVAHEERGIRIIIPSESQFDSATSGCVMEQIPGSKAIKVTKKAEFYRVELNLYAWESGSIYHLDWTVPHSPQGAVYPEGGFKVAQCDLPDRASLV
jgi:hypothetical protein